MSSQENLSQSNMVQGIDLVLVDVAFLTYNPKRDIHTPLVKLDSTCVAGIFELKKHKEMKRKQKYEMGLDAYKHYKWYNSCLKMECLKSDGAPFNANTKLKILHWHIESGNIEAFKMQGVTYKAVSIIISPTVEYWYCANNGPNALHTFGSRVRGNSVANLMGPKKDEESCEIWFEPLLDNNQTNVCSRDESCQKNNCQDCKKDVKRRVKNPNSYIRNKLEKENQPNNDQGTSSASSCSVLQAINLLNQKKNILRNGSSGIMPKIQNRQNNNKRQGLKTIHENQNS